MTRRSTSDTTARPDGIDPWTLLMQWQQQLWQAWPRVLAEAVPKAADGASPDTVWRLQLEALNAAMRQAALEQQALLQSWQQVQTEFAGRWREQVDEAVRRFDGAAAAQAARS